MIKTAAVNVEQIIVCMSTKTHTKQRGTLLERTVRQRIAAFSLPIWGFSRFRMGSIDIVKPMGKEGEKLVVPLLNGLKSFSGQ